ncbi:DNA ligase [Vibrio profundum]|uniref:DNA ligase n=1 Tax=Vibrio profundum TaxID=2910247 RepID=UPI003D0996F3
MKLTLSLLSLAISSAIASEFNSSTNHVPNTPTNVALANLYSGDIVLHDYWVSEKFDGIRAIWTGSILVTRSGKQINAPDWFTSQLPNIKLDGELWAGRKGFYKVQQTVLDKRPNDQMWRMVRYMVFDLPDHQGDFIQRYKALQAQFKSGRNTHVSYVEQFPVENQASLTDLLEQISNSGGEGLMLRNKHSDYQSSRSDDLLKIKQSQDAEGIVIGYKDGAGKYRGMMGSVRVKMADGVEFYIGSGFSDKMRKTPPALGSVITFEYNGLTHNGIPKFARFVRERREE